MKERIEQRKRSLLEALAAGRITVEEQQELDNFTQEDSMLREAVAGYQKSQTAGKALAKLQTSLDSRINKTVPKSRSMWPLTAAASVLVLIGALLLWPNSKTAESADLLAMEEVSNESDLQAPPTPSSSPIGDGTASSVDATEESKETSIVEEVDRKTSPTGAHVQHPPTTSSANAGDVDAIEDETADPLVQDQATDNLLVEETPEVEHSKASAVPPSAPDVALIQGTVTDDRRNPLPQVRIQLLEGSPPALTDQKGHFEFSSGSPTDLIEISHQDFTPYITSLDHIASLQSIALYPLSDSDVDREVSPAAGQSRRFRSSARTDAETRGNEFYRHMQAYWPYFDASRAEQREDLRIQFEVDVAGQPIGFYLLKSPGIACTKQAIQFLMDGPSWQKRVSGLHEVALPCSE